MIKRHTDQPPEPDTQRTRHMQKITATVQELAAAFTEWDRRWREEPDRFTSEAEHLALDAETYGGRAAPYLVAILAEQTNERSTGAIKDIGPS